MPDSFSKSENVVSLRGEPKRTASAMLARMPAEMHSIREKARQKLQVMFRALFDKADDALFELADQATNNHEQNLYFDSMRQVRLRRKETEEAIFRQLDEGFARLLDPIAYSAESETAEPAIDSLALVENDELEELVASETMINRASEAFAEKVQHLTLRIDQLVPVKVYQKNNPVGCDAICKAFVESTGVIDIDVKARLVLFKLFDKAVMTQLGAMYDALNQLLIDANVLPSLHQSAARRQQSTRTTGSRAGAGEAALQQGGVETAGNSGSSKSGGDGQILEALRQLLGRAPSNAAAEVSGDNSGGLSSQDLLGILTLAQHQQPVVSGAVDASPQDIKALVAQLLAQKGAEGKAAINQVDEDVINLVSMMFEFILEDRSLASPMKAQLARLQIPMIKVAIADKSFFGKGGHPARRLLNEMATTALGWQDNGEEARAKDSLYQKIDQTVERVLTDFSKDVGVFESLLLDFRAYQEKEKRRARILEQRTLDAEDGKAKSERARAEVETALAEVALGKAIPDAASRLLSSAWANVMFITGLKQGVDSDDWNSQLQTAEDLVWSVTAEMSAEGRQKLLKMVPSLLSRLRKGLEEIAFNPYEMGQLFKALEQLHLDILRGKVEPVIKAEPVVKVEPIVAAPAADATVVSPSTAVPVQGRPEAKQESIADGAVQNDAASAEPSSEEKRSAASSSRTREKDDVSVHALEEQHLSLVANLTQGSWFEVVPESGDKYRCRLAAIIKPTGKYIFVNRGGMKVAEETRETLALAIQKGRLRVLDDGMLFDRALESVIGSLKASRGLRT